MGKEVEELKPLCMISENIKWSPCYKNSMKSPEENKYRTATGLPFSLTWQHWDKTCFLTDCLWS